MPSEIIPSMDCGESERKTQRMAYKFVLITRFSMFLFNFTIAEKVTSLAEHTESRLATRGSGWRRRVSL